MANFFQDFSQLWLKPPSNNLTDLDLSMRGYLWGYHPRVDFRGIELPHIRSLRLEFFTFSHDWQLEWLSTLQSLSNLVLENCPIISHVYLLHEPDQEGYPTNEVFVRDDQIPEGFSRGFLYRYTTTWNRYFDVFTASLGNLVSFGIRYNFELLTPGYPRSYSEMATPYNGMGIRAGYSNPPSDASPRLDRSRYQWFVYGEYMPS